MSTTIRSDYASTMRMRDRRRRVFYAAVLLAGVALALTALVGFLEGVSWR